MSQIINFREELTKNPQLLKHIRQGVEREGLRVTREAKLAMSDHPKSLGSKLTHPFITTDYSENLLEYITSVYEDEIDLLDNLRKMHSFTYKNLENDELIWPWSMPAIVPSKENDIKVANYGSSNSGKLKELYRVGLGHRYGKSMQSIAGVHYNFSLSDEFWKNYKSITGSDENLTEVKNKAYFHLIRNYRRYSSILTYLFGSTPLVHESFLKDKKHDLVKVGKETFGNPFATSLRMGGLGYTSKAQDDISICYNGLETYISTLEEARQKSYPAYEKIGIKDEKGNFKQLNTNLLQIDNEFYSRIRPKNIAKSGQSALGALFEKGIEYIEVRLLDVDPFSDIGISEKTIRFNHIFLIACLCEDAPIITKEECREIDQIYLDVVSMGRNPELQITKNGSQISKEEFLQQIINKMKPYAILLDKAYQSKDYCKILENEEKKIYNTNLLPSSIIASQVTDEKSIIDLMQEVAVRNKTAGLNLDVDAETYKKWQTISQKSLDEQFSLEQDLESFEDFHKRYFEEIKINFEGKHA